jgi:4,5-dihydroxyphthalate decarboxylase
MENSDMQSKESLMPLTLAVAEYDRTRPLLDGRVQIKGIALKSQTAPIPEFCLRPVYEEYNAAEMSLSWYVMAHSRQEPVIALPLFPLRMPVHAYIFCRTDSPYTQPKDLVGKRIGTRMYRSTINFWIRGILSEHYGIDPKELLWVTTWEEGAEFPLPPGISVTIRSGANMGELLLNGEVDCLFTPVFPEAYRRGDPRIRRLFPNCKAEFEMYFRKTGIFPITHTIVMNKTLWEQQRWVAEALFIAFQEAQRQCETFYYADPKHVTLPRATFILEEERQAFGPDPWIQGLKSNRHVLEAFVRYIHEQGYLSRIPPLEELFARNTLSF